MLGVAQLAVGQLHASPRDAWMLGPQVPGVLQRRVVAGLLRLQRRPRIVERLLRDRASRLSSSLGALERLRGLRELGAGLLHVRRLLDVRQMFGVGRAVLRERAGQRRLLLLVGCIAASRRRAR